MNVLLLWCGCLLMVCSWSCSAATGAFVFERPEDLSEVTLVKEDFPPREEAIVLLERDGWGWWRSTYPSFERNYDGVDLLLWSRSHYYLAPIFCLLYLAFLAIAPQVMQNRKPFNLKKPLQYWNLLLATFSIWGALRVVPHTIAILYKFGWHSSLCAPPVFTYGRGAAGLWTGLFIYSKYFELLDTVFIVLRKRNLNFLHWYHHVTVLLYTWDAFVTEQPPGLFYCAMNYSVHSIMYFYYYLTSAMSKPPSWGMGVTILQIAQMIAGVIITGVSLRNAFKYPFMYRSTREIAMNPHEAETCYISRMNMMAAAAMYSTYFYLFAKFFVDRYVLASSKKKKTA